MKKMPTSLQAADYSAATTYLKAVQAAGTTDSAKVMEQLHKMKIDDMYAKGYIRPRRHHDSRHVPDASEETLRVQQEPWDFYTITATIPGEQAFGSKAISRCALWK